MCPHAHVHRVVGVEHPRLGLLRGGLSFIGVTLSEVRDRGCLLPDGFVEMPIDPRRARKGTDCHGNRCAATEANPGGRRGSKVGLLGGSARVLCDTARERNGQES